MQQGVILPSLVDSYHKTVLWKCVSWEAKTEKTMRLTVPKAIPFAKPLGITKSGRQQELVQSWPSFLQCHQIYLIPTPDHMDTDNPRFEPLIYFSDRTYMYIVTSTAKSSLFTCEHPSPLSLAARVHQCHTNHSPSYQQRLDFFPIDLVYLYIFLVYTLYIFIIYIKLNCKIYMEW